MTRFLLSLDDAVDVVFAALEEAEAGEIYVPRARSARMVDVDEVLIGDREILTKIVGIRPGEKIHEILVSEEEASRTVERNQYYAIIPALPQLRGGDHGKPFAGHEFSSADALLDRDGVADLIATHGLRVEDEPEFHR